MASRDPVLIFAVACAVAWIGGIGIAHATRTAPDNPAAVTLQARAVVETDGWCVSAVGIVTPVDLSVSVPARITAAERSRVLYASVRYIDDGSASTRACVVANATSPVASPCDALDTDAAGVMYDAEVKTYHTVPDTLGALPSLWASVDAGTGTFCVEVGY